jgi:lipopolysaccharide transport system ATP-binding protein
MSDTVIRVENLGKKYIIGHQQQERYTALRDVITNKVKSIGSLINSKGKVENPAFEEFWALKDVSFDIKQGDRVGIIGRNGAGKSTLLKILSRITEPTKGSIKIKGRVASLLEVGTGFHPELTGRENIFLNGAILGMGKEEIKRKFDEIVAFAEVEKFLDTPVKRYSSGMYVRLAFAVAAHLEPEILIVDEVLAVGDAQFQKKCLGKMEEVGKEGRTVIFVSHNMAAIRKLCLTGVYLNNGSLCTLGDINEVINSYNHKYNINTSDSYYCKNAHKESPHFLEISVNSNNDEENSLTGDASIFILLSYAPKHIKNLVVSIHIYNSEDIEAIHSSSEFDTNNKNSLSLDIMTKKIVISKKLLNVGRYRCKFVLAVRNTCIYDTLENISFEIAASSEFVLSTSPSDWKGIIPPNSVQWI